MIYIECWHQDHQFEEMSIIYHKKEIIKCHCQDQAGCARYRYSVARFAFCWSQVVCWKAGL
jgi:hypothetical protein